MKFEIKSDVEIPARGVELPDYGIPFAELKVGDSVFIPIPDANGENGVPTDHVRTLALRHARETGAQFTMRTIKNDDGEATGVRVWLKSFVPKPGKSGGTVAKEGGPGGAKSTPKKR